MGDLDSFHDRLAYGKVAEEYAHRILNERGIPYKTSQEHWGNFWTNKLDKQYGDIIISFPGKDPIWIDVK